MLLNDSLYRKSSSRHYCSIVLSKTSENDFYQQPINKDFLSTILMDSSYIFYIIVFQVHEYLFFSGLMLANTLLLTYLSYNYKYKSYRQRLTENGDSEENLATNQNELKLDVK